MYMRNLRERKIEAVPFFFLKKALFDSCLLNLFSLVRVFAIPWTVARQGTPGKNIGMEGPGIKTAGKKWS